MKTFKDFLNEQAVINEYENWDYLVRDNSHQFIVDEMNEATNLYAAYIWDEACKAQKQACVAFADIEYKKYEHVELATINEDSILNCPNYPNPFKTEQP